MAERLSKMMNIPQSAYATTTPPAKVATGTARKTMLQIQANPAGPPLRIVDWFAWFDASALAVPGLVELVDTGNQGASGSNWTAAKMPQSTVGTAITSGATTTLVLNSGGGAAFPASQDFSILAAPILTTAGLATSLTGAREKMLVTTRSTDTLTVVRNIDAAGAQAAIPIGSPVWGLDGQFEQDIICSNSAASWPPSSVIAANCGFNNGSGANGTDFGSITRSRFLETAMIEPIGGLGPIQLPLSREHELAPGDFLRIVMTFAAGVNALCGLTWAE